MGVTKIVLLVHIDDDAWADDLGYPADPDFVAQTLHSTLAERYIPRGVIEQIEITEVSGL
jgi:hypothetical protein